MQSAKGTSAAWLVGAAALLAIIPPLLQSAAGPKLLYFVSQQAESSPAARVGTLFLQAMILGACAVISLHALRTRSTPAPIRYLVIIGAFPFVIMVSVLFSGQTAPLSALLWMAVAVALWAIGARSSDLRPLGWATAALAALSLAMGVLTPSRGTLVGAEGLAITYDKALIGDSLLTGPLQHPNSLAQALVLGLPFVLALQPRGLRVTSLLATVGALVWTGSRTCLAVAVLVLALSFFCRRSGAPLARTATFATVSALLVAVVAIPLSTTDARAWSGRGQIWSESLAYLGDSLAFGLGAEWYEQIAGVNNSLLLAAYHGHNMFLNALVTGGLWLVAVLAIQVTFWARAAWRGIARREYTSVLCLIAFLGVSVLEVPWRPLEVGALFAVGWLASAVFVLDMGVDTTRGRSFDGRANGRRTVTSGRS